MTKTNDMKQKMTKIIRGLLIFSLVLILTNVFSQTKYTGYFCTGVNQYTSFQYTREYKEEGDTYITLYKIYSPTAGYYLNITATHYKSQKKIVVSIDDITVPTSMGHIGTQEFTYETPSLELFGRRGAFQSQFDAQGTLPNDLALKFVSNKFENVKVVNIVKDNNLNATKWYILDEKN